MEEKNIDDLLELDTITIEPVPQKKGMILRHVEYLVKSERFRSEVKRRYSDFQALYDLLLHRFPYRLIPKMPPAKLMANVVGVSSDFIEERRKALIRWLTIITSHPVLSEDSMIKYFLTDNLNDHATTIRDQFRHFPDEFVLNELGPRARDIATAGLRSNVMASRGQVHTLQEVLKRFSQITGKICKRSLEESEDMSELTRELASIGNQSVFAMLEDSIWKKQKDFFYAASKEIVSLGSKVTEQNRKEEVEVHQKILLLLDVVSAHADLSERHEKGLTKDHKVAIEKIGMIKSHDLRGALSSDTELRDAVVKAVSEHEIVLTDLESRQAFALICIESETKLALMFASLLAKVVHSLGIVEQDCALEKQEIWKSLTKLM